MNEWEFFFFKDLVRSFQISMATVFAWTGLETFFIARNKKFSKLTWAQLGLCLFTCLYSLIISLPSLHFFTPYSNFTQYWSYILGYAAFACYFMAITEYLKIKTIFTTLAIKICCICSLISLFDFLYFVTTDQHIFFYQSQEIVNLQFILGDISLLPNKWGQLYTMGSSFLVALTIVFLFFTLKKNHPEEKLLRYGIILSILVAFNDICVGYFRYLIPLYPLGNLLEVIRFKDYLKVDSEKKVDEIKTAMNGMAKLAQAGESAGSIAHDINNPLTLIEMSIHRLEGVIKDKYSADDKLIKHISRIKQGSHFIKEIVRTYTKLIRNEAKDKTKFSSLSEIFREAVHLSRNRFLQRKIELKYDRDCPYLLKCRDSEMMMILINLIINAADAIQELEDRWIYLTLERIPNGDFHLMVTDSGAGIPKKILPKIFDLQFTTKGSGKGTGIGLGIVRQLILEHGFDIFVDQKQKNTCFVIKIPKASLKMPSTKISA